MDTRRYIPDHAATSLPILLVLLALHYYFVRDAATDAGIESTGAEPVFYEHWLSRDEDLLDVDAELARLRLDDAARDRQIRELLQQGRYQRARTRLLEVAAAAVLQDDQVRLGDTMLLLGDVAIHQQELAAAEIYLQEALYLAMSRGDVIATARSYQLLGRLNIRARELARRAAVTYDELWQARNLTARGLYHGVADSLQRVVRDNLEIRRYGAAADAWEALAALYDRLHDGYQAQLARIEAAKLFASTGQTTHVRRLLDGLDRSLVSDARAAEIEQEVELLSARHQQDQVQASQARDYQMLYHHYLRRGQIERAWQFRIKASATLAETSDRALFRRQADVIAVLYNSNFAMDRARRYLDRAGAMFDEQGAFASVDQTRALETQIY